MADERTVDADQPFLTSYRSDGRVRNRVWRGVLIAVLAGGSLFTSCVGRVWSSVIDGSKDYVYSLMDPAAIAEMLFPEESDGSTSAP